MFFRAAEPLVVSFDARGIVTATSPAARAGAHDPARLLLARGMGVLERILADARATHAITLHDWETDGVREPLAWTALRVPDSDGRVARVVFTAFERETVAPSQKSDWRFNVAPGLEMWVFDRADYRILHANALAATRRGYSVDELMAMRITDLRPIEHVPRFVDELTALPAGQSTKTHVVHVTKSGDRIAFDAEVAAVDGYGHSACIVLAHDFR